jgi:hypothetical protein
MGWAVSISSIIVLYLMGRKFWWAPITGLGSQALWIIYVIQTHQKELMLGVLAFTFVTILNVVKWTRERPRS